MSGMNPTYQSGFASPQRGRMKYPGLWRGCVGAWSPALGNTGLTLRDQSGYGNHGTLTNMAPATDWVASSGRYALDFDATNDFVSCGVAAGNLTESVPMTASAWVYARTFQMFGGVLSRNVSAPYAFAIRVQFSGKPTILCDGVSVEFTSAITANRWTHIAITFQSLSSRVFYANGKQDGASAAAYTITANSDELRIGTDYIAGATRVWDGMLDDIRIYNRSLSANEIGLLASRRGIAYEIAPRRRSISIAGPTFKAAWLTSRQSQIIGGGMR